MTDRDARADEEQHAAPAAVAPRRRRRRRWPLVLAMLLAVAVTGVAVRVAQGPIHTDLVSGRVAEKLAAALGPGTEVGVGVVGFGVDDDLVPVVELRDLRIRLRDGNMVSIDTMEATTGWATLAGRDAAVSRLSAEHVLVELAPGGQAELPDPFLTLAYLESELLHSGLGYAEVGGLTVYGRSGAGTRLPLLENAAVKLASPPPLRDAAVRDPISFEIAGSGDSGPWSARMQLVPEPDGSASHISIDADAIDVADIGRRIGEETPLLAGPVNMQVEAEMDRDGGLLSADATLTAGRIVIDGDEPTTVMEEGRLSLRWRPESGRIEMLPSSVMLTDGRAMASGTITPPQQADDSWGFRIDLATRGREDGVTPQRGRAEIEGRYRPASGQLDVDRLVVDADGTVFNAAMRLSHSSEQPVAGLSGVFRSMTVERLKQLWPPELQPHARSWVRDHVLEGTILDAEVDLAATLGAPEDGQGSASLSFRFRDLAFTPFGGSPVIRKAVGSGRLADGTFSVSLESGEVELDDGRTLAVPAATFEVPDVMMNPPDGSATIALSGDAAAMLALWQRLPLSDGIDLGVGPADLAGRGEARIAVSMPLIAELQKEQIAYDASVDLTGLAANRPVAGHRLADGNIHIELRDAVASVRGTANVDGVAAKIDMTQPLAGGAGASKVSLRLGDEDRRKLGIDLTGLVSGPVDVVFETLPGTRDGASRQRATVDLAGAEVTLAPLGWSKARGTKGSASFVLTRSANSTAIEEFRFAARDARIEGALTLDAGGKPTRVDLPVFRLSRSDRLSVKLTRNGDGAAQLVISGDRFDARDLIAARLKQGGRPAPDDKDGMTVDVAIGTVLGYGDVALRGVNMDLELAGSRVTSLSLTAQSGTGAGTSASLRPEGNRRRLSIEVGDMGSLLRALDIYSRAYGGRATIDGLIDASGRLSARLDGQRWQIVGEPALSRLATAVPDHAEEVGETVDVRRLIVDLVFADGRLDIIEGVLRSPAAGLTMQGDVDFGRSAMRLSGSYLPAGAFDSLLGRIPILGQTLFAGGRAGLVGVTFKLTGPISEPSLTVNPLSVVAPGVLRKLFELG